MIGGQKGNDVGAQRILNQAFRETLRELTDDDRTFACSIDYGPSQVSQAEISNYVGRVQASPMTEGGGTFVEWSSAWERTDDAASEFCGGIYNALLKDMKKSLEG